MLSAGKVRGKSGQIKLGVDGGKIGPIADKKIQKKTLWVCSNGEGCGPLGKRIVGKKAREEKRNQNMAPETRGRGGAGDDHNPKQLKHMSANPEWVFGRG